MSKSNLTAELLREFLNYDPQTGIFTRAKNSKSALKGKVAGSLMKIGYLDVSVAGEKHLLHRLAWLYMTGEWPKYSIDHIDGNKLNNAFSNLRDEPHKVNTQNTKRAQKNSASGIMGVRKQGSGWSATIHYDGSQHYLGIFKTAEEAHAAYIAEKRKYHRGFTL